MFASGRLSIVLTLIVGFPGSPIYTQTLVPARANSGTSTNSLPVAPEAEITAGGRTTIAELGAYAVSTPLPSGQPLPIPAE